MLCKVHNSMLIQINYQFKLTMVNLTLNIFMYIGVTYRRKHARYKLATGSYRASDIDIMVKFVALCA